MNRAGQRGTVVRGEEDSLHYRLMLDDEEATITAAEVQILARDGSELVARTATDVTYSGAGVTYKRTWSDSTFDRADGFRAVWFLTSGGVEYTRRLYFDVVFRAFYSQLTDSDITDVNPYIQAPSGLSDLSTFRREAWRRISDTLRQRMGTHPGNIFYPEQFFQCHRLLTMSVFYFAVAFQSEGSEDWDKYEELEAKAMACLEEQISKVSVDEYPEDGIVTEAESKQNYAGISLVR